MGRVLSNRGIGVALFVLALALYIPGVWWGLPVANAPNRHLPWGLDELGPLGPLAEFYSVFLSPEPKYFNPQYPLLPYAMQALTVGPYVAWQSLMGGMSHPMPVYPFGFSDPVASIRVMTLLGRLVSLFLAAGTVVIAFRTALLLWDDQKTAVLAGLFVLLQYPMFYYGRTSNVDAAGLFWMSLGFWVFAGSLRVPFTVKRAVWLGLFTAFALSTKDAYYAFFLPVGAILIAAHYRRWRAEGGSAKELWRAPLAGLLTAAGVYIVTSGFIFHPGRYWYHIDYVRNSTAYFKYPATFSGLVALTMETGTHLVDSMGWPMLILSVVSIVVCARKSLPILVLLLPPVGIFAGTILPVHFVNLRYVMPIAYVLSLFAAYGFVRFSRVIPTFGTVALIVICGWPLMRAGDLTYQMLNDSRYMAGEWLQQNTRPGDRVGYYTVIQKIPRLDAEIRTVPAPIFREAAVDLVQAPEFILIIPQQHFETEHESEISPEVYRALQGGDWGYQLVLSAKAPSLVRKCLIAAVNPSVKIFARKDVIQARLLRAGIN